MRVLRSTDVKKITCPHCGSRMEIDVNDVQISDVGHPCSQWINCGVCGRMICLGDGDIPRHWWVALFGETNHH